MSTRALLEAATLQPAWVLALALLGPVVLTLVLTCLHEPGGDRRSPWKYLYSAVIFTVFIPGIFFAVTTGYTFFCTRESLLEQSPFVLFGPFATMVMTVQAMKRVDVDIDALPGFGRLLGLVLMVSAASLAAILLNKVDLRVWFFGSASSLFWLFGGLLLLVWAGWWLLFSSK